MSQKNIPQPDLSKYKDKINGLHIGLVSAGLSHMGEREEAHSQLVRSSFSGALSELEIIGVDCDSNVTSVEVPGALEIPLMAKKLIETKKLDGVIAFALIVDGGIYRHEFVAQSSLDALVRVSLDTDTPIASCVLTPVTPKSPEVQFDMLNTHLKDKGVECVRALVGQIIQLKSIV